MICTGIYNDSGHEIELTSESGVHVHRMDANPTHLFDGKVVEIMSKNGRTMVRIEPDERYRSRGFTGGLWFRASDIRLHNGGGWVAEVPND